MPTEWRDTPWPLLKRAANARTLHPRDVKGLGAEEREEVIVRTITSLNEWEEKWGAAKRVAPELMDEEELAQEATILNIEIKAGESSSSLLARVRTAHITMQTLAVKGDPTDDDIDDDDDVYVTKISFDHPEGLALTQGCGKSQDWAPLPLRSASSTPKDEDYEVSETERRPIFDVIVEHKVIRNLPFFGDSTPEVVMEVKVITGFWEDCRPDAITYEACSRLTGRKSRITASALRGMATHDNPSAANAWGAKEWLARREAAADGAEPAGSASPHSTPPSGDSNGTRTSVLSFATWLSVDKADPASPFTGLFSLPKVLTREGCEATIPRPTLLAGGVLAGTAKELAERLDQLQKDREVPIAPKGKPSSHTIVDGDETEHLRKTQDVIKYLSDSLGSYVDAIQRRHEPYVQPGDVNLYNDTPFGPRMSNTEKLDDLLSTKTSARATQNICSFCVICTWHNIQDALSHQEGFDVMDPEQIKACIAYADNPRETGCKKCISLHGLVQPLHPNPFVPTACGVCSEIISCEGSIYMGCPYCKTSYVVPLKEEKTPITRSPGAANSLADATLFQYLRLTGGTSSLFQSTSSLLDARKMMVTKAKTLYQEARSYIMPLG